MRRLRVAAVLAVALVSGMAAASDGAGVAVLEDLQVDGATSGDVVCVGGDITLGPEANVDGDVVAVFGTVRRAPGAQVAGRAVSVSSLGGMSLHPAGEGGGPVALGVRLLLIGGWLLVVNVALLLFPGIRRGVGAGLPVVTVGGLILGVAVAATLLVALVAMLGLGPLAVPAVLAVLIVAVLVKIVGLAAVSLRLGRLVVGRSRVPSTAAASVTLLGLLLARLIPVVGGLVWSVASVLAFGAGVLVLSTQKVLAPAHEVEVRPARLRHPHESP